MNCWAPPPLRPSWDPPPLGTWRGGGLSSCHTSEAWAWRRVSALRTDLQSGELLLTEDEDTSNTLLVPWLGVCARHGGQRPGCTHGSTAHFPGAPPPLPSQVPHASRPSAEESGYAECGKPCNSWRSEVPPQSTRKPPLPATQGSGLKEYQVWENGWPPPGSSPLSPAQCPPGRRRGLEFLQNQSNWH